MNGKVPLIPPASAPIRAAAFLPINSSIFLRAFIQDFALGSLSTITVGAPITAIGIIRSLSSTSEPLIILQSVPFSNSCLSIKPPTYGSPPPPVPRNAVPLKKSSRFSSVNLSMLFKYSPNHQ